MIYAETATLVADARKRFVQTRTLQCPAVVECLEEAGGNLFTFCGFRGRSGGRCARRSCLSIGGKV
jgi:hypothetical protein